MKITNSGELKLLESTPFDQQQVITALNDTIIIVGTDLDGKIIYANDHFCEISGYAREELLGKTHSVINSGHHNKAFFADMWKTISSGEVWHNQIRNKRKNGEYYWVDTKIFPIFDQNNKITQYLALRYDITSQKNVESDFRENNIKLEEVLSSGKIGIWDLNTRTGNLTWTPMLLEIKGFPKDVKPTKADFFARIHPQDLSKITEGIENVMSKKNAAFNFEYRYKGYHNLEKEYCSTMQLIESHNGADDTLVCIVREISEQKLNERIKIEKEAAEKANLELQEKVKLRTEQLMKVERSAFVGMHTAEIAHDMNNPMAIIKLYLSILELKYPDEKKFQVINESVGKIISIIRRTLQSGRQESDQIIAEFCINEVIESELKLFELDAFFKAEVKVEKKLQKLPLFRGQISHFNRIIGNLIKNAVDALYGRSKKNLKITTSYILDTIIIRIEDSGCGISEENLNKIFDPFFTTKPINAIEDGPVGTGLGLPSVKRILEGYGGEIEFASVADVGTSVTVKLPLNN